MWAVQEDRVIRDIYWSSCTFFICAKGFVFIAWQVIISLKKGSEKPLFDVNFVVESSHCIALLVANSSFFPLINFYIELLFDHGNS